METLENSLCYCYTSYEMTDQFLWFQLQMNSYSSNWNTPYLSQLLDFKNAIWTLEEQYAIKFCFRLGKKFHVMKAGSTAETKRQSSQWKHAGSPKSKKARQSKSTHKLLMIPFFLQHWHDLHLNIYTPIYMFTNMYDPQYKHMYVYTHNHIQGAYDKFPDLFRMGTFIDSTYMKL